MRVVVTGAAGFIGRAIVRQLAARGDHVVALVRDPATATHIAAPDRRARRERPLGRRRPDRAHAGADGLIHAAGSYRVGIPCRSDRRCSTRTWARRRVLDAAIAAGVPRIVYVSTVNIFGNTRGKVVDETYRRDPTDGFLQLLRRDEVARPRSRRGAHRGRRADHHRACPGQVYGPGDHSPVGQQLHQAYLGTAAVHRPRRASASARSTSTTWRPGSSRRSTAARSGETYVARRPERPAEGGDGIAARAAGHGPPRLKHPELVLAPGKTGARTSAACSACSPNLREILKPVRWRDLLGELGQAGAELGYRPRDLASGFADAFGGGTR